MGNKNKTPIKVDVQKDKINADIDSIVSLCGKELTINNSFNQTEKHIATAEKQVRECDDSVSTWNVVLGEPVYIIVLASFILLIIFYKKIIAFIDEVTTRVKNGAGISGPGGFALSPSESVVPTDGFGNENESKDDEENSTNSFAVVFPNYQDILDNSMANKILATLWKYQQQYQVENPHSRWSFTQVGNPTFQIIANRLCWSGLIMLNGNQYMLSNVGMRFCKHFSDNLTSDTFNNFR